MKTLYFECGMGAAGDMLLAALLEIHPQPEDFIRRFHALGIPGVRLCVHQAKKCGIIGTNVIVTVNGAEEESLDAAGFHAGHQHGENGHHTGQSCAGHQHEENGHHTGQSCAGHQHGENGHRTGHQHAGMQEIAAVIQGLEALPEKVKQDVLAVYNIIAEAESAVHNCKIEEIHFHEVGSLDAVADIVGVCMLIHELAPDRIMASPVHLGSGQVHCAHGILPVPAPATAYILKGVPSYGGTICGELCTPTGAALLKYFVQEFGSQPVLEVQKIGYGMGKKDFPAANCVRALLGEEQGTPERITELACNLDDMTPEAIGFAAELLLREGALDVYVTSIQMKKNRPGVLLACLCREADREKFLRLIFRHTATTGVREYHCDRYVLERRGGEVQTSYGTVRKKISEGYGVRKEKPEYEDVAEIARNTGKSLSDIIEDILESK
ncbi:MAG: nickel pincer cofactor biosynthesis protein LarC [Clostridiaceae bacterium]|nr:nickel pincer cofactor biosynthesis protein LarC [Clostridiaceae bacterium]